MKSKKEVNDWLKALEAERHDQSWRTNYEWRYQPILPPVIEKKQKPSKFRDEIMWNAGRFAAGERDEVAVNAHKIASRLLKGLE